MLCLTLNWVLAAVDSERPFVELLKKSKSDKDFNFTLGLIYTVLVTPLLARQWLDTQEVNSLEVIYFILDIFNEDSVSRYSFSTIIVAQRVLVLILKSRNLPQNNALLPSVKVFVE
jgi:hypothetical protein